MPSANESVRDSLLAHQVMIQRLSAGERRRLVRILNQGIDRMIREIGRRGALDLSLFGTRRLEELVASFRAILAETYRVMGEQLAEDLVEFAVSETQFVGRAIDLRTPPVIGVHLPSAELLRSVVTKTPFEGMMLGQHISRQGRLALAAVSDATSEAVLAGHTLDDLIRTIRGTRAKGFTDGILDVSRRNAAALARTGIAHAAGAARTTTYEENSDIVKGEQWHATLDGRTTLVCMNNDGATRDLLPGGKWGPWSNGYSGGYPAHWGERSTKVPVLKSWEEMGLGSGQVSTSQRASLDGLVSGKIDYETFLRRKAKSKSGREFIREVLGDRRAKLFFSGEPLDRFVDDLGRPLKLAELGMIEAQLSIQ